MTTDRLTADLRMIGRHLAQAQLRESSAELSRQLRHLLAELPQYVNAVDRLTAEALLDRIGIVVDLCDVVSSSPE